MAPACLLLAIGIVVGTAMLVGSNRVLPRAAWSSSQRLWAQRAAAVVLIGGFMIALALALVGGYEGGADRPPALQIGVIIAAAIAAVAIWQSRGSAAKQG
jgi:hypothetical protein